MNIDPLRLCVARLVAAVVCVMPALTQALPLVPPAIVPTTPLTAAIQTDRALQLSLVPSDHRVSLALGRFAQLHGWTLAWEIDRDFPIDHAATFQGSFLDILHAVVLSLQNTDSPIRIQAYSDNRVLRVIHATQ